MAQKRKMAKVWFVRAGDYEIGPFRTREGALAEARAMKAAGYDTVKVRVEEVAEARLRPGSAKEKGSSKRKDEGRKRRRDDDFEDLFDDDDEDDEDDFEDLFDDDDDDEDDFEDLFDDDDEDDEDDDEDEAPKVTHPWFRKLGKEA